jgi:hypothetical protein
VKSNLEGITGILFHTYVDRQWRHSFFTRSASSHQKNPPTIIIDPLPSPSFDGTILCIGKSGAPDFLHPRKPPISANVAWPWRYSSPPPPTKGKSGAPAPPDSSHPRDPPISANVAWPWLCLSPPPTNAVAPYEPDGGVRHPGSRALRLIPLFGPPKWRPSQY